MLNDASLPTRTFVLGMEHHDGTLRAAEVLDTGRACGLSYEQIRLCLRRLVTEGTFRQQGRGRSAVFHRVGDAPAYLVPENEFLRLAYEQDRGERPWDGRWRLVGFNVPEANRAARDALRERIAFLGGAPIHGGLYTSPHDWHDLIAGAADDLGVEAGLTLATTDALSVGGVGDPRALAARLWPLAELAARYERLAGRLRAGFSGGDAVGLERRVLDAFAIALPFTELSVADPLLPPELLPTPWPGYEVRATLAELVKRAEARGGDPDVAIFRSLDAVVPADLRR